MVRLILGASLVLCSIASGLAQTYPDRTIKLVVGFTAGPPDTVARILGNQLSKQLGQPVVIENRSGANGMIGADAVAKSPPDGYTLLLTSASYAVNPSTAKKMPFDPIEDLIPITNVAEWESFLLVTSPSFPANSLGELIALAKRPDSKISYGSPGVGNTIHLAIALFASQTGINILHVPYRGAGPAITGLLTGEIQMMFLPPPAALALVRDGKLKALAYNNAKRLDSLPNVPTFAEAGVATMDVGGSGWYGVFAPAKTPPAVITKLHREIKAAVESDEVRKRLATLDVNPVGSTPEEFRASLKASIARFAELVRLAGVQPE